jgi:hypothetical protein
MSEAWEATAFLIGPVVGLFLVIVVVVLLRAGQRFEGERVLRGSVYVDAGMLGVHWVLWWFAFGWTGGESDDKRAVSGGDCAEARLLGRKRSSRSAGHAGPAAPVAQ